MTEPKPLTPHNRKVLDLLMRSRKPLSAYDILGKLSRHGLRAPPTIYRALDYLVKHGLAHKIQSLNAFVACHAHVVGDTHEHISQFAICRSCGTVEEIEDPSVEKALQKVKQKFLQTVEHEVLEISGLCCDCATQTAA